MVTTGTWSMLRTRAHTLPASDASSWVRKESRKGLATSIIPHPGVAEERVGGHEL